MTSALIGIAIDKGAIPSEEENAMRYFPEYQNQVNTLKNELTLKHLLTMRGGFAFGDFKMVGYYCGGGKSYYTARDLARIGQVYLNKGDVYFVIFKRSI